jgi:succinyl-diaminopimelate desuccinylase
VDRRFLLEEGFDATRAEIVSLLDGLAGRAPGFRYRLRDLMVVNPVRTPPDSPLVPVVERAIAEVLGRTAAIVASPGTYDHKHVARAGVAHCIAYGPGILELAHQPDEWCAVEDLIAATKVLALTILDLSTMHGRTDGRRADGSL